MLFRLLFASAVFLLWSNNSLSQEKEPNPFDEFGYYGYSERIDCASLSIEKEQLLLGFLVSLMSFVFVRVPIPTMWRKDLIYSFRP